MLLIDMRYCFLLIFLLSVSSIYAQKKEFFLNHESEKCIKAEAAYFVVQEKTDSGTAHRQYYLAARSVHHTALYKDDACKVLHGAYHSFYPNKQIKALGQYRENKKDGVWLEFHPNGIKKSEKRYLEGRIIEGYSTRHDNGRLCDSVFHDPEQGMMHLAYFKTGTLSFSGSRNRKGNQTGVWRYYHVNGQLSAEEVFEDGRVAKGTYFDEQGNVMQQPLASRPASFPGGERKMMSFIFHRVENPEKLKVAGMNQSTTVVEFTIDIEGRVTDPFIAVPFMPAIDNAVLRALEQMPHWEPAIHKNRKIPYEFSLPYIYILGAY